MRAPPIDKALADDEKEKYVFDDQQVLTIEGQLVEHPERGKSEDQRDWVWLSVMSTWANGERIRFRCFAWDHLAIRATDVLAKDTWVIVTGRVRGPEIDDPHRKAHPVFLFDVDNFGRSERHQTLTKRRPEAQPDDSGSTARAGTTAAQTDGVHAEPAPADPPAVPDAPATSRARRGPSALPRNRIRSSRMTPRPRDRRPGNSPRAEATT